jgi:hypothetical protein
MSTPQEKGNALEAAVFAIEFLILQTSPYVEEKTYTIEQKKHIHVAGVHHEIDLFVTFDLAPGYNPVFIFECKNWNEKTVGKNDIIIFKEKIAAAGAHRGFFVAKAFTSDAEAMAKLEPRMELVLATEHDPIVALLPPGFGYQSIFNKVLRVNVQFRKWGSSSGKLEPIDISKAVATMNGATLSLTGYVNAWINEAINQSMLSFPSGTFPNGVYQRECEAERPFLEGVFKVNDQAMEKATLKVQFEIYLVWPAIKSHFEVNGRGRFITFEAHTVGDITLNELQITFGPEK